MPNPNPSLTPEFKANIGKHGGKRKPKPEKIPKSFRINKDTAQWIEDYAKSHKLSQGDALDKIVQTLKEYLDVSLK